MKNLNLCFVLCVGLVSVSGLSYSFNEMDRVFIYLNNKLAGTWRADESGIVHIDKIADGDTLIFKARADLGGLSNSSIDVKDDAGVPVENIQSKSGVDYEADYVYIFNLKKIDTAKTMSLQVFLNLDPARSVAPSTIASITMSKK